MIYCPNCGIKWEDDKSIFEYFHDQGYSWEKADEIAKQYGCTEDNPKSFLVNVVYVKESRYNKYHQCTNCNHKVGSNYGLE